MWLQCQCAGQLAQMTHPLVPVRAEEPGVVPLLHHHKGDARLIVLLQLDAGLADG